VGSLGGEEDETHRDGLLVMTAHVLQEAGVDLVVLNADRLLAHHEADHSEHETAGDDQGHHVDRSPPPRRAGIARRFDLRRRRGGLGAARGVGCLLKIDQSAEGDAGLT